MFSIIVLSVKLFCILMKLQDARTISATELYDRRKQAILLYKKGNMTQIEIGEVVGVGRNVICEWIKKTSLAA